MKLTFMGAGSTVFAKNVLGDVLLTPALNQELEIALYDIDGDRLEESRMVIDALNKKYNDGKAKIGCYLGVENRKDALRSAKFVVNAIQVGLYDPCTIIDFDPQSGVSLLSGDFHHRSTDFSNGNYQRNCTI